MRRTKRISAVAILAAALILLISAIHQSQGSPALHRYTATFFGAFDTVTEVVGYAETEEAFTAQVEQLKERLMYYHRLYDIYNEYPNLNNIKTINEHAGIMPVKVDKEIAELLLYSKELYEYTDGRMNIAMGSVLSIWHTYREAGNNDPGTAKLPPMEELKAAAEHMDIGQLQIDEEASAVYLADGEMSLDVGSIGKGYAVQKVAEYAREIGMEHVLISVGGNVCAVGGKPAVDGNPAEDGNPAGGENPAVGGKPAGSGWRLGIQNPDLESMEAYAATVEVTDASVVTSGDYQRYYMVDGKRYGHIVDPATLMPADHFPAVTIIAEDSGLADGLTTALYNMSVEDGIVFANGINGMEAVWVLKDGSLRYTDGFERYLVK